MKNKYNSINYKKIVRFMCDTNIYIKAMGGPLLTIYIAVSQILYVFFADRCTCFRDNHDIVVVVIRTDPVKTGVQAPDHHTAYKYF